MKMKLIALMMFFSPVLFGQTLDTTRTFTAELEFVKIGYTLKQFTNMMKINGVWNV